MLMASDVVSSSGVSAEHQRRAHSGGLHRRLLGKDHLHCCSTGTEGEVSERPHARTEVKIIHEASISHCSSNSVSLLTLTSHLKVYYVTFNNDSNAELMTKHTVNTTSLRGFLFFNYVFHHVRICCRLLGSVDQSRPLRLLHMATPSSSCIYRSHIPLWS